MVSTYTLFSTFAVHHLVIGGILLVLLGLSFRFIKPSAEVKSWLWLTAFLVSTLVPFSAFIPKEQSAATFKVTERIQKLPTGDSDVAAPVISVSGQAEQQLWHMPEELVFKGMILLSLFVAVWLLGSLWRFFSIFKSFINTRQVVAKAVALPKLSEHNYPVAMSRYTSAPMVVGLFNPVVILPENIVDALDERQLKPIIMHEIAHIKRGDLWFSLLQELLAIVFWWSPVMRQFNNHIHINRELACDYRAIKALDSAKAYAQSLLECAKIMVRNKQNLLAVGLFSKKKELSNRIDAALNSKEVRASSPLTVLLSCLLLAFATISAAESFAPKVNVDDVVKRSKHFSQLARKEGEALFNAVMREDAQTLEFLVKTKGIDIDTPAIGDGTALIIAVKKGLPKMVDAIMDLEADVDQSSRGDGNPLIMAAMTNNVAIARQLLDYGADVNAVVVGDETPLINASRRGSIEMVELLVANGADVNLKVKTGMSDGGVIRSPLNMARTQAVKDFLIAQGATP